MTSESVLTLLMRETDSWRALRGDATFSLTFQYLIDEYLVKWLVITAAKPLK
jgi:hypothetical protein